MTDGRSTEAFLSATSTFSPCPAWICGLGLVLLQEVGDKSLHPDIPMHRRRGTGTEANFPFPVPSKPKPQAEESLRNDSCTAPADLYQFPRRPDGSTEVANRPRHRRFLESGGLGGTFEASGRLGLENKLTCWSWSLSGPLSNWDLSFLRALYTALNPKPSS